MIQYDRDIIPSSYNSNSGLSNRNEVDFYLTPEMFQSARWQKLICFCYSNLDYFFKLRWDRILELKS